MRTVAAVQDSAWTPDGTQPPPPPPTFDDPLAGLVTGAPAGSEIVGDRPDQPLPQVRRVSIDSGMSEAMLAAMLDDEPVSKPVPAPAQRSVVAPGMFSNRERRSATERLKQAGGRVPNKNTTGVVVGLIMFAIIAIIAIQIILSIIEAVGLR